MRSHGAEGKKEMRLLTIHAKTHASPVHFSLKAGNGRRLLTGCCLLLVICVLFGFGVPSVHAATASQLAPRTSGNGYDFLDPVKTGCNRGAYQLGALNSSEDTYHARVFWSPTCQTNYAYVISPDGSPLLWVEIERSTWTNVNCNHTTNMSCCNDTTCSYYPFPDATSYNTEITCSQNTNGSCSGPVFHLDDQCMPSPPNCIPSNSSGTTWLTNMLYSPTEQFRVEAMTQNGKHFFSYWH